LQNVRDVILISKDQRGSPPRSFSASSLRDARLRRPLEASAEPLAVPLPLV